MAELLDLIVKYGLGIVMVVFVLYDSSRREQRMSSVIDNHLHTLTESLMSHDQRATDAIRGTQESNRYQREEHMKLMDGLTEVVTTLRRLNGKGG